MQRLACRRSLRLAILGLALALAVAIPARAETAAVGDWAWDDASGRESGSLFALTMNDADQSLGQFCYPGEGKCYWVVTTPTPCTKGGRIPILVNGEEGAASAVLHCLGEKVISGQTHHRLVFADFDAFDKLMRNLKQSPSLGVVLPTDGDKFRVMRFSLNGAQAAIDAMRKRLSRKGSSDNTTRGTSPATETL